MSHSKHTKNTLTRTVSQIGRQLVHPLERNDPVLVDHVDFVTLEFLERATHPIPKNQRLNKQEASDAWVHAEVSPSHGAPGPGALVPGPGPRAPARAPRGPGPYTLYSLKGVQAFRRHCVKVQHPLEVHLNIDIDGQDKNKNISMKKILFTRRFLLFV